MAASKFTNGMNDYSGVLLTAAEARHATPHEREDWVNNVRGILQNNTQEQIDALPLGQKLSLVAGSYGFWLQHIGNPKFEEGEWDKLRDMTTSLPPAVKEQFIEDLALQGKALKSLAIQAAYFRMEDRVHERAYEIFMSDPETKQVMKNWAAVAAENFLNQHDGLLKDGTMEKDGPRMIMSQQARDLLDAAGVTQDKIVATMMKASEAMNTAWKQELATLGITEISTPIQVLPATKDEREIEFNVRRDPATGESYYKVGDRNATLLDPRSAMHVAFHEPHHRMQDRIAELMQGGTELPGYMQAAKQVFRLIGDFGAANCPPDVLAVDGRGGRAEQLANENYALSLGEQTALYQGNRAAIEINRTLLKDIAPKLQTWLGQSPAILDGLSAETKDWLAAPKKEQPASVSKPASLNM